MGRIAEEEREKVQVRLDKIEQIFCINSGDFIPKSRNYECTNGGAGDRFKFCVNVKN